MSDTMDERDAALTAIGPIDGRYRARTRGLAEYFSEYALIRYRVRVEIEWYLFLRGVPGFDAFERSGAAPRSETAWAETARRLRAIYEHFSLDDARRIKEIEGSTNHDVKAVEYFLRERFAATDPTLPLEVIHFACTSEDISNIAWALMLREFAEAVLRPALDGLIGTLGEMARRFKGAAMIARTHGQAATPTTMGKELAIYGARLERQFQRLERQEYLAKFNGAVGNFNAHLFAYPELDWLDLSKRFVESFGLVWNPLTTQIECHDFIGEIADLMVRIAVIVLDFARDIWAYVSLGYFRQRPVAGEVGSSTMPHKVNPIDFENAEGNLGVAIALFQHLSIKLPVSRWQRDLSDSTAMRSLGTAFGHVMVALDSVRRGLGRLDLDQTRLDSELDDERFLEVVAEAIQTVMRRYNLDRPYERLKDLTRGRPFDRRGLADFVATLPLDDKTRASLAALSPRAYLGLAELLAERYAPRR
jgi:adenylosuccinate lyase